MILFTLLFLLLLSGSNGKPNIIVIVVDDVGFADVSYNSEAFNGGARPAVPTPEIDKLAGAGVKLDTYYVQSTCTPTRASIMTGRYATNTGLVFAMLPGSLAGLPNDMATMPQVLRKQGYRAHAVGKWHVGHSTWAQTPVGRGFETHVGSYLWSMGYRTKELWAEPWNHFAVDWVRAAENGSYTHYAEPRHTTRALTEEAVQVMERHAAAAEGSPAEPLFMYLAYTAAHAPLVPEHQDRDGPACRGLKHEWRRDFCGLMQGLDRAVGTISRKAQALLGPDTVVVFTSDNGGAPWFGGLNYPLRSGKTMPFEGGVRVPAFVVDFTADKRYFGPGGGRRFPGLAHCSDWLPTLASVAGASAADVASYGFDGMDLGPSLRGDPGAPPGRESVLIEMYYHSRGEFLFPEDVVAYRKGRFKLIVSDGLRDGHWYHEPVSADALNSTDPSWATWFGERALRWMESFTTEAKFDATKDILVHLGVHAFFRSFLPTPPVLLFDLEADPEERVNLADSHLDVVKSMEAEIAVIRDQRPEQAQFWMTIDRDAGEWRATLKPGNCSMNPLIAEENCLFTHPWIADDADLSKVPLVFGAATWPFVRNWLVQLIRVATVPVAMSLSCVYIIRRVLK